MRTIRKSRIKVALDPSAVIDLFTLIHPKHDIDGKVMNALKCGNLRAEDWQDMEVFDKPKLLQDKILGRPKDGRFYNLENVYTLLQGVLNNEIQIHITPTTLITLTNLNDMELDFLQNHITTLTIRKEDEDDVYDIIFKLAQAYIEEEKKIESEHRVFEHDHSKAYVIAEAALCGLPLVTNDMSLIHTSKGGYEISRLIKKVNREFKDFDLAFNSKAGNLLTPTTMPLSSFIKSLSDERFYLYPANSRVRVDYQDDTINIK